MRKLNNLKITYTKNQFVTILKNGSLELKDELLRYFSIIKTPLVIELNDFEDNLDFIFKIHDLRKTDLNIYENMQLLLLNTSFASKYKSLNVFLTKVFNNLIELPINLFKEDVVYIDLTTIPESITSYYLDIIDEVLKQERFIDYHIVINSEKLDSSGLLDRNYKKIDNYYIKLVRN